MPNEISHFDAILQSNGFFPAFFPNLNLFELKTEVCNLKMNPDLEIHSVELKTVHDINGMHSFFTRTLNMQIKNARNANTQRTMEYKLK